MRRREKVHLETTLVSLRSRNRAGGAGRWVTRLHQESIGAGRHRSTKSVEFVKDWLPRTDKPKN